MFVSRGEAGPAVVPRDIEGGVVCRVRRVTRRGGDVPGPIPLVSPFTRSINDTHDKEHLSRCAPTRLLGSWSP